MPRPGGVSPGRVLESTLRLHFPPGSHQAALGLGLAARRSARPQCEAAKQALGKEQFE